jgi:hypothetical protein
MRLCKGRVTRIGGSQQEPFALTVLLPLLVDTDHIFWGAHYVPDTVVDTRSLKVGVSSPRVKTHRLMPIENLLCVLNILFT